MKQTEEIGSKFPASSASQSRRYDIGPFSIDPHRSAEFSGAVVKAALTSNTTHLVVTANAQFYVLAQSRPDYRSILQKAEFVCADGVSIAGACKLLTGQHVDRIPGVDLIETLCALGAPHGMRIFLFGGKPEAASDCVKILSDRYAGICMVGSACPDYGFEKDPLMLQQLIEEIRESQPNIVFVGLGAPKQEQFIEQYLRPIGVPVAIGVGGSFEMISGRVKRAPQWIRNAGLEWFYRLMLEPARLWRRYLIGNCIFAVFVASEAFKRVFASMSRGIMRLWHESLRGAN